MGTMALRDTDLLLLQCSISLHPTPLDSGLPSANDVFFSGPPEFLNNRTEADEEATAKPKGVVMEAKPQLVGIHERVRNDIDAQPS
ncbi:unnamed protein product [Brassica napus]|uniref:(rape) hypothetical protein n=1 Tax=Brassica napus TaxID=3708 RepID=A0A817AV01_BRANA|nr:unnamed protein product [Brassica napus]